MEIPGLGTCNKDKEFDWYVSKPIAVDLIGKKCKIVVEDYDEQTDQQEFHDAIESFLALSDGAMKETTPYLYQYYLDFKEAVSGLSFYDFDDIDIERPDDVWNYIELGDEPMITRRHYGDKAVYVSIEGNCAWEEEHGLQIVYRHGKDLCKVSSYDGHLTNSDSFADDSLEDVIYYWKK